MEITTTRFGNIIVEQEKIISFPEGIPGFEDLKRYIFLPEESVKLLDDNLEVFHWLQSVGDPAVAFLVVNPYLFFADYSFDLPDEEVAALDLKGPEEVALFNIVTIPGDKASEITVNLLAPIVINNRLKQAKQSILINSPYFTKHPFFTNTEKSSKD